MIEYMTDKQNPKAGNPQSAMFTFPHKVNAKMSIPETVKILNTSLLSIILSNNKPKAHPMVMKPQNFPTVAAPSIDGFKP